MEIPSYKELLKLVWFLVWRHVVILMFVSMTIGWAVPVIFNSTVPEDSQYILEICIYGVLFLVITPFILKTLFQKQFQGFQVNHPSFNCGNSLLQHMPVGVIHPTSITYPLNGAFQCLRP